MRQIPDDIATVASSICTSVGITDSHARKVFAAAILTERERCAKVARDCFYAEASSSAARAAGFAISVAIMSGEQP